MLDGMKNCTCVNNAQVSTGENNSILCSQNNNNNEVQTMRNHTSAMQRVTMNLGALWLEEVQPNNVHCNNVPNNNACDNDVPK